MNQAIRGMAQFPNDQVIQEKPMTKALVSTVEISVRMFMGFWNRGIMTAKARI